MNKVSFSRDSVGEWRWVLKDDGNYKVIGASSEGFDSYRNAYNNAYMNYHDTVEYEKWPHEDTDDTVVEVEVEDVQLRSAEPVADDAGAVSDDTGISPED